MIFLAVLVWFYRIPPWLWTTYIPGWMSGFGDVIEALWQIEFWRTVALTGRFDPVSLAGMYPLGLHQFSIAHVGTGLLLLPASPLVGSAAALNIGFVVSHITMRRRTGLSISHAFPIRHIHGPRRSSSRSVVC